MLAACLLGTILFSVSLVTCEVQEYSAAYSSITSSLLASYVLGKASTWFVIGLWLCGLLQLIDARSDDLLWETVTTE